MAQGYIYILVNSEMPDCVKVGRTTRHPTRRASELSGTAAPVPFRVVRYWKVKDEVKAEQDAHHVLSQTRVRQRREFFRLDPHDAIDLVEVAIRKWVIIDTTALIARMDERIAKDISWIVGQMDLGECTADDQQRGASEVSRAFRYLADRLAANGQDPEVAARAYAYLSDQWGANLLRRDVDVEHRSQVFSLQLEVFAMLLCPDRLDCMHGLFARHLSALSADVANAASIQVQREFDHLEEERRLNELVEDDDNPGV